MDAARGASFLADKDEGPQRGFGRPIPPLVSKIQVATTNAGARAQGGLTPDFLALSLDHGHIAAIPRGSREDYRASRRPLLRHLIERSLQKAIISARWMAGQRDENTKKNALQR